jgi:hypothetical protein
MNNESPKRLLLAIRKIIDLGYRNLRFISIIRKNYNLLVGLRVEMNKKARGGIPLVTEPLFGVEIKYDLRSANRQNIISLANGQISINEFAEQLILTKMQDIHLRTGSFDDEYIYWLDNIISICPDNCFPAIEDFRSYTSVTDNYVKFYPEREEDLDPALRIIALPPRYANAIDPYLQNQMTLQGQNRIEDRPGFLDWSKTHS